MSEETKLSKRIRDGLIAAGLTVFRVQSGAKKVGKGYMHFAPKGTPDIAGHTNEGRALYIEVKDEAKLTKEQDDFLRRATKCGCRAGVAHSVEEAIQIANGTRKYAEAA